MSRKVQPEVKVLEFFNLAPLGVATSILAVCQATVKMRMGPAVKKAKKANTFAEVADKELNLA